MLVVTLPGQSAHCCQGIAVSVCAMCASIFVWVLESAVMILSSFFPSLSLFLTHSCLSLSAHTG